MDKLFFLIRYWTIVFDQYRDILPYIFQLYDTFKRKGAAFPEKCESKYAYLLKNKIVHKPINVNNEEKMQSTNTGISTSTSNNLSIKKSPSKDAKVKKDFQIVRDNLELTNVINIFWKFQ